MMPQSILGDEFWSEYLEYEGKSNVEQMFFSNLFKLLYVIPATPIPAINIAHNQ